MVMVGRLMAAAGALVLAGTGGAASARDVVAVLNLAEASAKQGGVPLTLPYR